MKKKILTLILLIFCVALLRAQEFNTLVVAMDDGTSTKVLLGSQPKVSFNGTTLEIATNTTVLQFDRTKLRSFRTIYEPSTGVGGVKSQSGKFIQKGDLLIFQNLPSGSNVRVFGSDGRLMRAATAEGSYEISLSQLSAGLYIVNLNGISTKIILRK
jgi:hypothetical protein